MSKTDDLQYAAMGMAALLPGMQYAVEQMQKTLDEFRERLASLQSGEATPKKSRISPEGAAAISAAQKRRWASEKAKAASDAGSDARRAYWAKLTPAQRRKEMERRGMLGRGKTKKLATAKPVAKGKSFKGATLEEKWAMAREYRALPNVAAKQAWLKAHGNPNSSFVVRYREGGPKGPKSAAPVKLAVAS